MERLTDGDMEPATLLTYQRKRAPASGLIAVGLSALGCCSLVAYGDWLPKGVTLLHGYFGVGIGATGAVAALLLPGKMRLCIVIAWLALWFTAGYSELRASGVTDGTVIGGIIPYSDSYNYLRDTSLLIEGHNMTYSGSRRPLSDSYLASSLYLFRNNLANALAMIGMLSAVAVGLAAVEIRERMGVTAAAIWVWLIIAYYRRYLGELMSEHVGVALGSLSVAILGRAYSTLSTRWLCLGLFVLSLALNARAGAFLVLPSLVLASVWHWRREKKLRILGIAFFSIVAAFIVDIAFIKILGPSDGKVMSNYHNVAYGIVFGGDWHKAAADIPNYVGMDEAEQAREVYKRISFALTSDPFLLWRAVERNWAAFFLHSDRALGPYSFLRDPRLERILMLISGAGICCAFAPSGIFSTLVLAAAAGIILSVPFVPTADADLMRAYAATMPLMFVVPSFAAYGWKEWIILFRRIHQSEGAVCRTRDSEKRKGYGLQFWSVGFLAITLLFPLTARFIAPMDPGSSANVVPSGIQINGDLSRSAWIEFANNGKNAFDPHFISPEAFRAGIYGMYRDFYPRQAAFLDSVAHAGVILVSADSTNGAFLVVDARHKSPSGTFSFIAHPHLSDPDYNPSFIDDSLPGTISSTTTR